MELRPESAATAPGPPAWVMAAPWLLCGLISTGQVYFLWPARSPEPSILRDLAWQYPPWLYLAAAAPLVARLARRFPLARDTWARHLGPHLLANALQMLSGLADLLRLALDHTGRQLVPLKQELDFLGRYLAIEKVRFSDRLDVKIDVDPEVLDALVPNLILQPLVENAIRHGIAPRAAAGRIDIQATRERNNLQRLQVSIRDDGVGLPPAFAVEGCTGVGLRNVRARLGQLYPGEHRFEVTAAPTRGAAVSLQIPLAFEEPMYVGA